jgi:hypothetical protein
MTETTEKMAPDASFNKGDIIRRHLIAGWGGLVLFIVLGVVLEGLHAFKSPLYLDVENETRRFLFRLAHAHGALLSLLQLGVAGTFAWLGERGCAVNERFISVCFLGALVLLPSGFFIAGWAATGGDPGWGIVLVPGGAVCLLVGSVVLLAASLRAR